MNPLLLSILNEWQAHWKAMLAAGVASSALLADLASQAKGWEDVSLKVILLIAVVFLVRVIVKLQVKYEADNVEREKRVLEALNRTADSVEALTSLTQEQTDFFKSVVKNVVSERLQGPNYSIQKKDGA